MKPVYFVCVDVYFKILTKLSDFNIMFKQMLENISVEDIYSFIILLKRKINVKVSNRLRPDYDNDKIFSYTDT